MALECAPMRSQCWGQCSAVNPNSMSITIDALADWTCQRFCCRHLFDWHPKITWLRDTVLLVDNVWNQIQRREVFTKRGELGGRRFWRKLDNEQWRDVQMFTKRPNGLHLGCSQIIIVIVLDVDEEDVGFELVKLSSNVVFWRFDRLASAWRERATGDGLGWDVLVRTGRRLGGGVKLCLVQLGLGGRGSGFNWGLGGGRWVQGRAHNSGALSPSGATVAARKI